MGSGCVHVVFGEMDGWLTSGSAVAGGSNLIHAFSWAACSWSPWRGCLSVGTDAGEVHLAIGEMCPCSGVLERESRVVSPGWAGLNSILATPRGRLIHKGCQLSRMVYFLPLYHSGE